VAPPFWTLDRVAAALRRFAPVALPRGTRPLAGVSTDTRTVREGELFVALSGENFNAHDFLEQAVAKGAAAVVVSHPERAATLGVPAYVVSDTLAALGALGAYRRAAWGKSVIAVAGSNGKTTTKELIRAALSSRLDVDATTGNLNNLVGVPLTLLALRDEADVAVIEMGTNVPGEVGRLRALAAPDLSVVTSVGEEHLEGLGSLEQILREECSAYDGVEVAVAPADQPEVAREARSRAKQVVTAGLDDGDVRATRWSIGADALGEIDMDGVVVRPPVRGEHNLRNTMLALAVARACGVELADAARGIAVMPQPSMRLAWQSLGRATMINDAYNANPASMRAALDLLSRSDRTRQRVAILGTMRELGPHAPRLHDEIARYALAAPIDIVAGVGEMGDALRAAAGQTNGDTRVVIAPDVEELWVALAPRLDREAVILLKASRGVKLERLVPFLTDWAGA
jgi:UDP-N-acetylmuramoyl-tripeptide--D-alanyl-D-alanine ligase